MIVYVYLVETETGLMPRITADRQFAETALGRVSPVVAVHIPTNSVRKIG